jgi:hypothetical protein
VIKVKNNYEINLTVSTIGDVQSEEEFNRVYEALLNNQQKIIKQIKKTILQELKKESKIEEKDYENLSLKFN